MLRKNIFVILLTFFLFSCNSQKNGSYVLVRDKTELEKAIASSTPGVEIVLANGVWKDIEIELTGYGTKENPIVLRAETPGKVYIEGQSFLKFGGEYLTVKDLYFRKGHTPSNAVIEFGMKDKVANHCTFTNCVIDNFNQPQRNRLDHWIEFRGRHNELSNCNIIGKSNSGPTVRVQLKGNESVKNYHRIVNNHFGPRPRKGGPHGETIQIGDSETSMTPCYITVRNNFFDQCNGEVEVISNKSNFNEYRNNVFYKCEGSLVLRHGNYCIVDGNYFIGDGRSENMGGIRIINTGHWVTNNYFYNLRGQNFRSALAIMNGIPKSPLNRYNQVTDVVVAYNTWVNCKSPWQFSVGSNVSQKDVLPLSEIRSARPTRTLLANNIIYNEAGDEQPIVSYDTIDGIHFESNIINNRNIGFKNAEGLDKSSIVMTEVYKNIYVPRDDLSNIEVYHGLDFETITTDLLGNSRAAKNVVGAFVQTTVSDPAILDAKKYGASWYSVEKTERAPTTVVEVSADSDDLASKIAGAVAGDVIELQPGFYEINKPLVIDREITILSKEQVNRARITYTGESGTPAFELHPKGNLLLKNVLLEGNNEQYAFACLKENMSSLYNLSVEGCEISNFAFVLKAYKESFADEILFSNSILRNCENGIELSEETTDQGDYNVEFLTIENCTFNSIKKNVIDYYRGGYDESTIGGNLSVTNSTFSNCGAEEENGILINSKGIVNVDISNNTFKNNPVDRVALLWGAKNNKLSGNRISNSGKIEVQENIELKLMY